MDIKEIVDYYNGLPPYVTPPKTELVNTIMDELGKRFGDEAPSLGTVRNWLTGKTNPADSKFIPVLAEIMKNHEKRMKL